MTTNLVDAVTSHVSLEMIGSIGRDTGAPPEEVSRAVQSAAPAVVGGMIHNASSESGAAALLSRLTQKHEPREMLGSIFGDRTSSVAATVATASGARPEVASRALAVVTPIAAGLVGREAVTRRLGPQGLMQLLGSQRRFVLDSPHLPPGGLAGVLGGGGLGIAGAETKTAIVEHERRDLVGRVRSRSRSPWGIIGAVGAGAIALGLIARCGTKERMHETRLDMPAITSMPMDDRPKPIVQEPDIPKMHPAEPAPAEPAPAEEPTSKTTTTGAETSGSENAGQFTVHFDFASADLGDAEKQELQKLARSVADNPESRIEVVGHTDSVGENEKNRHLALERAVTVKKMLIEDGVDSGRINVITIGESEPSADNSTAEGRAENRRVDVIRK